MKFMIFVKSNPNLEKSIEAMSDSELKESMARMNSYNEDLKTVAVTLDILAFPSQGLNFGVGQQNSSIVPQSFATSQFFGQ